MGGFIKRQYNSHKQTADNFIWRSLQMLGQQGITFFIFILCARLLTSFNFGIYNYILAIIFFLIMFGDFGISTATSKYVAEYNITDQEKLRAVLFNSGLIIFALAFILSILAVSVGPWYLGDKYVYVLYLLPLIFMSPMTSLYDGVYRGLKKFRQLATISMVVSIVSVLPVYFLVRSYGLTGALISQNIFYFVLLLSLGFGHGNFTFKLNKSVINEIGAYSFTYGIAILGNYLFIRFGILILGHYHYIAEIGTYELLNKMFMILVLPFTLLGQVVAPNFAEFAVRKQYGKILEKTKKYTVYFFVLGIVLGTALYFIIPNIVKIFIPNQYNDLLFAILPFSIIIFVTNIWAATVDAGILVPTGYAKLMAKFYVLLGLCGTILAIILCNYIGYMGVIYSFALTNLVMAVGLRIIFIRDLYRSTL